MAGSTTGGATGKDLYEQVIDSLNSIFGSHASYRPAHAIGVMCEDHFHATKDAWSITRAPHMRNGQVPIQVRFSDFSGVPSVPDGDPTASPRGMAVRFQLKDGSTTDLVAHSYNGFPARDATEFLSFLRALASSGPGATKPTALDTFLANHPAARLFAEAPKPAPRRRVPIYQSGRAPPIRPLPHLTNHRRTALGSEEAAKLPDNYLFTELASRLSTKPIEFRLMIQLASDHDPIDDPTRPWPDDRQQTELGTLTITKRMADSEAAQRTISFDPARLPDGIRPRRSADSGPVRDLRGCRPAAPVFRHLNIRPWSRSERCSSPNRSWWERYCLRAFALSMAGISNLPLSRMGVHM